MMMDPTRRGKPLDLALFAQFRAAAPGPRKRRLLEQLMWENEPLAKLLTGQLCGFGESTRKRGFRAMAGCTGFRDLEVEDALQAGLIALQKALEQFDPSKGKFAPYAKLKLRHELQRLVFSGGSLVRVPRGKGDAIPVSLHGEEGELDVMGGGYDDTDLCAVSGSAQDEVVADYGEAFAIAVDQPECGANDDPNDEPPVPRTRQATLPPQLIDTNTPLDRFIHECLVFRKGLRVARDPLVGMFERYIRETRAFVPVVGLRQALFARGVRPITVRVEWHARPVAGFADVAIAK
jgi:sigma-70-like protein